MDFSGPSMNSGSRSGRPVPEMLASRVTASDGNYDLGLMRIRGMGSQRLLIFRPHPRGDGFLDVVQSFFFVFSLGDTSRQSRAFGNNPAVLGA